MTATRVAKHLFGDNLYFGHAALADLLEHETLTGLIAMGVGGRRPTDAQRCVLDGLAVIVTSADPRIWPLKLTRLVSSYGGVLAGFCAGQLGIEGERIGYWVTGYAAAVLAELRSSVGESLDAPDIVAQAIADLVRRRGRIPGFGVPLRPSDERMDALRSYAARTELDRGAHWRLQEALSGYLERERGIRRNICMGLAAVLLDLGYTAGQTSALAHFLSQSVFVANAFESAQQQAPEMQKLADEHIDYVGPPRRPSPRALALDPHEGRPPHDARNPFALGRFPP